MNPYIALADHINHVYALRYTPHSEDSAFVRVFAHMLSPEEAGAALRLDEDLKTAEALSAPNEDAAALDALLHDLAQKGIVYQQLEEGSSGTVRRYRLLPFIPGIFEALIKVSGDPDIAGYLHQYAHEMDELYPKRGIRRISVNQRVEVVTHRASREELRLMLEHSDRFAVMDCLCRTLRATSGRACGHPIEDMCIITGEYVDYYVRIGNARAVSRLDVETVLRRAEAAGLFHEIYPIDGSGSAFICNCCACGCMFLSLNNRIRRVIRGDGRVALDPSICTGCGRCVEQCPQQVFDWDGAGIVHILNDADCIQCGLCTLFCPAGAVAVK